jgi:predicted dehydrogenase
MVNAAIAGLGWWGQTLVESVSGESEDIRFVAGVDPFANDDTKAFTDLHKMDLHTEYEAVLADDNVDAVVLATPHSLHTDQVVAAAAAGKQVFCEKPFALHKADAERSVEACQKAGVTLGLDYNRRLHPEMTKLRDRIDSGDLGTILHVEANMTFPNALFLKADAWRADREEAPCGGLTPMGIHAIDGMIDLCGEIDELYCQSFRRVVEIDADDTTSILFRMKEGMSGYLGTMTATGGGFSFQVFGSKGFVRLEGMTHIAGAPSEERRKKCFGTCIYKPIKGPAEVWEADEVDIVRAVLEEFAHAVTDSRPYFIPAEEMIHGASVTETVVKSAASHQIEKVA